MSYRKDPINSKVSYLGDEKAFHHPDRMKRDAAQCINDVDMWLTIGYSLALHMHHVLMVLEEHDLTYILEENVSVRHLFNDQVTNGKNAAKIAEEREDGSSNGRTDF